MGREGGLRVFVAELKVPACGFAGAGDDAFGGGGVGEVGVLETEGAEETFLHEDVEGFAFD